MDVFLLQDGPPPVRGTLSVPSGDLFDGNYVMLENTVTGEFLQPAELRRRITNGDLSVSDLRSNWVGHRFVSKRLRARGRSAASEIVSTVARMFHRLEWDGPCVAEIVTDPSSTLRVQAGERIAPVLRAV